MTETTKTNEAGTPYKVEHHQAVWEITTFTVVVPPEIPQDEHEEWIKDNLDEEMATAISAGTAHIEIDSQSVETCDTVTNITPEVTA